MVLLFIIVKVIGLMEIQTLHLHLVMQQAFLIYLTAKILVMVGLTLLPRVVLQILLTI